MILKYNGNLEPKIPSLQIPGWAGNSAVNSFQFWTDKTLTDAATLGIELIYPYDDITIPDVVPPFIQLNDLFYSLDLYTTISTPDKTSLLVIPHYRFYTDTEWSTPIPVSSLTETDWWHHLNIIFKMPPKGYITKFKKGEPFAQAIIVPRKSLTIEKTDINDTVKPNLATREWITSGFIKNNLYEVLSHLEKQKAHKKYKIIK